MLHKIKTFIRNTCILDNFYGFYCPDCAEVYQKPTAYVRRMWDEKQKCFKKYIQCDECLRTTPAYKDKNDAAEQRADQWKIVQGSECMLNKN